MSAELVPFDPTHAATVAAWPASAAECVRWCGRPDFPLSPHVITTWADEQDVDSYLLVRGGAPVAYGELWREPGEAELARLVVAPAARRQGVGRQLVNGLVALAAGASLVSLRVHPDNDAAIRLYLATGFHRADATAEADWNTGQPLAYRWFVR